MPATTLYAPLFPQMEDDGKISLSELTSSGVVINTPQYLTARSGDFVELWFESYAVGSIGLAVDPVSQYFPWQCDISPDFASLIPDGVYKVQYNVVDAAQNSSWSSIGKAIVDRTSGGTLPPPIFSEAGTDNTLSYNDAISGGGTPVTVPAYPEITAGDNVILYWVGLRNNKVVQQSVTTISHTVKEGELNGFDVLIATAFIIPELMDSAKAWYVVQNNETRNERSENGMVNIDTSSGNTLPPPDFIEGDDAWIDADEAVSDGGTSLHIPVYPGMGVGDMVTVYWQGFNIAQAPVPQASYQYAVLVASDDLTSGFQVTIPTAKIVPVEIGYGIGYYSVLFATGEQGSSPAAEVGVDVIHSLVLPAPVIPEAEDDGVIDDNDAMSNGGCLLDISYPAMTEGDNVTAYWSCYNNQNITPVPGTVYSTTRSVSASEAAADALTFTIPSRYITPTGLGYAVANYSVNFHSGGIGYSDDAIANIHTQGDVINGSNYLGGSTGYAPWDNTVIQGCFVKYLALDNGIPLKNVEIIFNLYGNNYFTNNKQNTITLNTDLQGYVTTNISGSDTVINTITAQISGSNIPLSTLSLETERTNDIPVPFITSEPYIPGSGNRPFTLSVSQDMGTFTLSTNNSSDIYINGVNQGGVVNNINVYSSSPLEFSVSLNNLNNTIVTVSGTDTARNNYCSYYF